MPSARRYHPAGRRVVSSNVVKIATWNVNSIRAYKLEWYRRLRAFLAAAFDPGEDLVLCGDLNIAPEERDVWDPEQWRGRVMCSEPERDCFRALVGWGLADALRMHQPETGGLYTWWDYRAGAFHRNRGLRIDHILLSPSLAKRCSAVEIDREERKGASHRITRPSSPRFRSDRRPRMAHHGDS